MPQAHHQDKLLSTPAPHFTQDEVRSMIQELYGLSGELTPLGSERDQNFLLSSKSGDLYVVKIANSAEDPEIIDMQLRGMQHINRVDPGLPVPKVKLSRNEQAIELVIAKDGRKHPVRVVTYLPGVYPREDYLGNYLYRQMGACLGRMTRALRGYFHPAADYELLWDLKHASKLWDYFDFIKADDHREMIKYFLERFDQHVLPEIPKLRAQIVHNDLVPDNMLVKEDDPEQIVGIIDFGDMVHTSLVIDLATCIAATLRESAAPADLAVQIVTGYNDVISLEKEELRVLFDLIGTRLAMLNLIASWRDTIHPENHDYIVGGIEQTWRVLKVWREQDPKEVTKKFFRACDLWEGDGSTMGLEKPEPLESLLKRREDLLGPNAYLFYEEPLHIVRGEGVWLYDSDNNRYLDVYNNVPQVGHCHPHVVKAISDQARILNTSTRYLHQYILDLAERLTKRLPDPLRVCTFVCTGSEANELAWRMAQLLTGNTGALITSYSYHGGTGATAQFSTESLSVDKLPSHVKTVYPPESNQNWRQPDSGVRDAIKSLNEDAHQPAMLLLDTSFVSDGIFTSPEGYLKTLFEETRAAGGICVADEVQGGFGRFGEKFWGFEFDDVIPDIVTMGKPMGNGHPLAAVVTTPEIAGVLARENGYFNTFGGNPVSCAAGLAVLDVIEKEGLQDNALQVGQCLIEGLGSLQKDYPVLGQVHGSGLLLGIDIITADGKPDPETADRIMNHLRQNGVLIGTTGPQSNVLKIRPPLVFKKEHAEILLAGLASALGEA